MDSKNEPNQIIHYRGFLLFKECNQSWLVHPKRSPMRILPFRTSNCSVSEVKKQLDIRLSNNK